MKHTSHSSYAHTGRKPMLSYLPPTAHTMLDVGCHSGGFAEAVRGVRPDVEIWGVEPNPDAAELARKHVAHIVVGTFTDSVAVPDRYFDVVVFNDVLEHFVDPWSALRIAARKLTPTGVVVASIPNVRHIDNLLHILVDMDFRYEPDGVRDRTHLRFFTQKSILRFFEESDFSVLSIVGINPSWWTGSLLRRIAFRVFARRLEDTKYIQFAVVARPNDVVA